MRVVILTGNEIRHKYFWQCMKNDGRFEVAKVICESNDLSLENRLLGNKNASEIELKHAKARSQRELDFFADSIESNVEARQVNIIKGEINSAEVKQLIFSEQPDLLLCFGSSLVGPELVDEFSGKFINVHLGLSPYYRGSGTNIWPLINREPQYVGATFMHIDNGIDSGEIIHQIQADIAWGDGPHEIGNRLIRKMTAIFADLVAGFERLCSQEQPTSGGRLYRRDDFDENACRTLYNNFQNGLVEDYLSSKTKGKEVDLVRNLGLLK